MLRAQETVPVQAAATPAEVPDTGGKRIFGIIPNYRTTRLPNPYTPLTAKQKFSIATQDAFDRGTFILAAAFAGEAQLTNSNPAFGQGAAGYARYLAAAYGDYAIGDFMTEAIYPVMLHQDPRFFQRGTGSAGSRFAYAVGQTVVTHGDNGHIQFNFSEVLGNSTAVLISNAYYKNGRDVNDNVIKLAQQIGVDAVSNVLKEFWPDVRRKLTRKHSTGYPCWARK